MKEDAEKRKIRLKKVVSILKICLLLSIILGIPAYIFFYHGEILAQFESIDALRDFLLVNKGKSALIYVGIQIAQLVISVLPGQALQIACGYVFGIFEGFLLTFAGGLIGTVVSFYISRFLLGSSIRILFDEEKINHYIEKLNSKKALAIIFVIYLVPGLPKDLFTYAAGASNIRIKPFLILSMLGRVPAMLCSLAIGDMARSGTYMGIILILVLLAMGFLLGIKHHESLAKAIDKLAKSLVK